MKYTQININLKIFIYILTLFFSWMFVLCVLADFSIYPGRAHNSIKKKIFNLNALVLKHIKTIYF